MAGDKAGDGGVNKPFGGASLLEEESGIGVVGLSPLRLLEGVCACEGWGWVVCEVEICVCDPQRPPVARASCSVLMLGLPGKGEGVTTLFSCWITARPLCTLPPLSPLVGVSPPLLCLPPPPPSSCFSLLLSPPWSHSVSSSSSASLSLAMSEEADTLSSA